MIHLPVSLFIMQIIIQKEKDGNDLIIIAVKITGLFILSLNPRYHATVFFQDTLNIFLLLSFCR